MPCLKPVVNQRLRCSAEPWVKASGTTRPCALLLQRVVADRGGGLQRRLDVAGIEELSCAARNDSPRRRRSNRPAIRPAPGCGWPPPCCRRRAARAAPSAGCRAGSARDGRPRARSHRPARIRRPCRCSRGSASRCRGRTRCRDRCAGRSGNRTAPSRPARSRSRPAPSRRTAAAAARGIAGRRRWKMSLQVSSVLPSTAATNWPVSSVGAPVRRVGLPVGLLVLRAAAGDHFGAADQHARIDAERPADQAEHDHGADAEPAAADRKAETAAAEAAAVTAIVLDIVAAAEIIPAHSKRLPNVRRDHCRSALLASNPAPFRAPPQVRLSLG